jgi:hypothetical protein
VIGPGVREARSHHFEASQPICLGNFLPDRAQIAFASFVPSLSSTHDGRSSLPGSLRGSAIISPESIDHGAFVRLWRERGGSPQHAAGPNQTKRSWRPPLRMTTFQGFRCAINHNLEGQAHDGLSASRLARAGMGLTTISSKADSAQADCRIAQAIFVRSAILMRTPLRIPECAPDGQSDG